MSGTLPDLLISTVHRTGARPERKATQELVSELRTVAGKQTLLFLAGRGREAVDEAHRGLGLAKRWLGKHAGPGNGPLSRRERDE